MLYDAELCSLNYTAIALEVTFLLVSEIPSSITTMHYNSTFVADYHLVTKIATLLSKESCSYLQLDSKVQPKEDTPKKRNIRVLRR